MFGCYNTYMDVLEKLLDGLNTRQLEAVKNTEGYIRVIAGAGSGKTRALTRRYAYLVEGLGISPTNILCVTFTNKAANEMKARVKKLIGNDEPITLVCTYHGFCVKVLREDINKPYYPRGFTRRCKTGCECFSRTYKSQKPWFVALVRANPGAWCSIYTVQIARPNAFGAPGWSPANRGNDDIIGSKQPGCCFRCCSHS